ncbi:hypothetical protein J2S43_005685 [Catenuloplanes nepalensis]|uniref:Uncharacterized protein n=1 Tax=Catenuloplanes nepalensis TaxID=587533 RepID=A0ABT9N0F4_9ACTN|nr:hypothetical protein [Catenuloplanes nepalensis]
MKCPASTVSGTPHHVAGHYREGWRGRGLRAWPESRRRRSSCRSRPGECAGMAAAGMLYAVSRSAGPVCGHGRRPECRSPCRSRPGMAADVTRRFDAGSAEGCGRGRESGTAGAAALAGPRRERLRCGVRSGALAESEGSTRFARGSDSVARSAAARREGSLTDTKERSTSIFDLSFVSVNDPSGMSGRDSTTTTPASARRRPSHGGNNPKFRADASGLRAGLAATDAEWATESGACGPHPAGSGKIVLDLRIVILDLWIVVRRRSWAGRSDVRGRPAPHHGLTGRCRASRWRRWCSSRPARGPRCPG